MRTAPDPVVITWDYREQLPLDELHRAISDLSGGRLDIHEIETGSDQYAIVVAPPGQEAAQAFYEQWLDKPTGRDLAEWAARVAEGGAT